MCDSAVPQSAKGRSRAFVNVGGKRGNQFKSEWFFCWLAISLFIKFIDLKIIVVIADFMLGRDTSKGNIIVSGRTIFRLV